MKKRFPKLGQAFKNFPVRGGFEEIKIKGENKGKKICFQPSRKIEFSGRVFGQLPGIGDKIMINGIQFCCVGITGKYPYQTVHMETKIKRNQ